MKLKLKLHIDGKEKCYGVLTIHKNTAMFGDGDTIFASIDRPTVPYFGPHGIQVDGFAMTDRHDKTGMPLYKYVEWYCTWVEVSDG